MKKIISLILALMLVLCMGAAAFAEDTGDVETPAQKTEATLAKVVTITNEGTTMPAETFTFSIANADVTNAAERVTVANMPTPTIGTAVYEAGNGGEKALSITLPTYTSVGVYTYTITENAGKTAGMDYDTTPRTLKVTVVNGDTEGTFKIAGTSLVGSDDKKSDTFNNVYSAGKLDISKTVTGNLGDESKYFDFTVTLIGDGVSDYAESFAVDGGSYTSNPTSIKLGEATTFKLKHGETIHIANLPYGVSYTVTEADYTSEGYTTSKTSDTGTINSALHTAAFTNDKTAQIDMGISTDSLPYIMLLGIVTMIGAAMFIKRRVTNN